MRWDHGDLSTSLRPRDATWRVPGVPGVPGVPDAPGACHRCLGDPGDLVTLPGDREAPGDLVEIVASHEAWPSRGAQGVLRGLDENNLFISINALVVKSGHLSVPTWKMLFAGVDGCQLICAFSVHRRRDGERRSCREE